MHNGTLATLGTRIFCENVSFEEAHRVNMFKLKTKGVCYCKQRTFSKKKLIYERWLVLLNVKQLPAF
jgi:hypothetical protein